MNTVIKGRGNVKDEGEKRGARGLHGSPQCKIENPSTPFIKYRFMKTVVEG